MNIIKTKNGKNIAADFDNLGDFVEWVSQNKRVNGSIRKEPDNEFYNMPFEDAIRAAACGWSEGTEDIEKLFSKLSGGIEKPENNTYGYDVCGEIYDIGRIAEGIPECALIPDSTALNKIYHIALNISKSAGVTSEQIKNLGAAVSALVQTIQTGGDSVKIDIVSPWIDVMGKNLIYKIPVDCSLLDIDQLMFVNGCPAMLRRLVFTGSEILTVNDDCHGYGYPASLEDKRVNNIIELSEYDLLIDSKIAGHGMEEFDTVESSIDWINKQLDSLTRGENESFD